MARDVVLDIIIAKMIAKEYMAGYDDMVAGCRELDTIENALITKGLLKQYVTALSKGDLEKASEVSDALGHVYKAMELFNYSTGARQVEVARDERGRFSRYLTGARSSQVPKVQQAQRKYQSVAVSDQAIADRIQTGIQTPVIDARSQAIKETAESEAGQVRAISRFQDELLDVFGEKAGDDIVVVVENIPVAPGQMQEREALGLHQAVTPSALEIAQTQGGAKMTMGLREGAKPETREKFLMFEQLLNSGLRPDVAADMVGVSAKEKQGAAAKLAGALTSYAGAKPDSRADRAKKHFDTMGALGSYFMNSGSPQLAAAGKALKTAATVGGRLDEKHYELAERMNYRFRGRKDNLPEIYTESSRHKVHQMLTGLSQDPNLNADSWYAKRDELYQRVKGARAAATDRKTGNVAFGDPTAAEIDYLSGNMDLRASPRNFVDKFTRDIAVASLIGEIPSDKRAVELGRKAGYGVPSSGIVIRADGQAKEMYRGVGEDHYLPFSAKALPELRDGQYVRTRTLGGLTPEDITTIVTSGGRRATVISGSGLFSIELRPDVSLAGRMRSPEVAAMGERYERILDQVAESGMYMRDLPPDVMQELRAEARKFVPNTESPEFRTRFDQLVTNKRAELSELTPEDMNNIRASVTASMESLPIGGASPQQRAATLHDLQEEAIESAKEEKVRKLMLNAEGYALALETLRLQYPDIIRRVEMQPLRDFVAERNMGKIVPKAAIDLRNRAGAKDVGLVAPNQTRSTNRQWSEKVQQTLPGYKPKETTPATTTVAVAGAGGAGAGAGAGAGVAAAGDIGKVRTEMKLQHDEAFTDAAKLLTKEFGSLGQDPAQAQEAFDFSKDESFTDALESTDRAGLGVGFKTNKKPAIIIKSPDTVARAAKSPGGLTVLLTLAYGRYLPGDTGWGDGTFDAVDWQAKDANGNTLLSTALMGLDATASAAMLRSMPIYNAPFTNARELGFYVPKDVLAAASNGEATGALQRVDAVAGDQATVDGRTRSLARSKVNEVINSNNDLRERFLHSQTTTDPASDLSPLGLLGVQDFFNAEIDKLTDKASADKYKLGESFDPLFYNTPAEVKDNKEALKAAYQSMFGTEYLRRSLGGGATGPKALGLHQVVAKEQPLPPPQPDLLLQQQVELLLQSVQEERLQRR